MLESRISVRATEKLQGLEDGRLDFRLWKVTRKSAWKDIVNWPKKKTKQLYKVSSPCLDDCNFKKEELESVGEMSNVCTEIVLKCLYLVRIGGKDILWSVNKLTRTITKPTQSL